MFFERGPRLVLETMTLIWNFKGYFGIHKIKQK